MCSARCASASRATATRCSIWCVRLILGSTFNDALTANLRRGRFLLLIVGDGIREGVEAIAEYLQLHAGLHFSLGLVELPIYVMPNGDRWVAPRVLARTALVTRNVVAVPDGYSVDEAEDPTGVAEIDPERTALGDQSQRFWTEFLDNYLELDDPEQPKPKPARLGYISCDAGDIAVSDRQGCLFAITASLGNSPGFARANRPILPKWLLPRVLPFAI